MNIEKTLIQKVALLLIRERCDEAVAKKVAEKIITIHANHLTHGKVKKHDEFFDTLFKALAPYEREIKAMLHRIWDEERRIILANLKKLKKAHVRKDTIDDILYPKNEFIKKLSKETKALYLQLIKERGQYYLSQFKPEIAFDVTNPRVVEWLDSYIPEFSKNLEAVNASDITKVLSEGMKAGETIPELMARINETFETWDRYRAEIISRTESSRASNQAWLEGAKQSWVVEKKVWLAAPGCCEECDILDGTVVELDGDFFEADYGTGDSPPLHPNCRCSIAAEIEETSNG